MRGRRTFSANELHQIEHTLRQLRRADPGRRRRLQERLRREYRFYVSDFPASDGRLTPEDVEALISQGVIRLRL